MNLSSNKLGCFKLTDHLKSTPKKQFAKDFEKSFYHKDCNSNFELCFSILKCKQPELVHPHWVKRKSCIKIINHNELKKQLWIEYALA